MEQTFDEALRTLGAERTADLVTEAVVEEIERHMPARIYVTDENGWRSCACTRCGDRWQETRRGGRWPEPLKQGTDVKCPRCGEMATVKHMGVGHAESARLIAEWYVRVDENTLGAVCAQCRRIVTAYDEAPWNERPVVQIMQVGLVRWGEGGARWSRKWVRTGKGWRQSWERIQRTGGMHAGFMGYDAPYALLFGGPEGVIAETKFARAWDESYLRGEPMLALHQMAKYPCVEYLTKLGLTEWLERWLEGELPRGAVNWRGKRMDRVLGLTREELGQMKAAGIPAGPRQVLLMRAARGADARLRMEDLRELAERYRGRLLSKPAEDMQELAAMHPQNRRTKAVRYLARQSARGTPPGDVLDYWRDCKRLEENLTDDEIAFPADVQERHERLRMRIDALQNRELDEKIAEHAEGLEKEFGFSFGGLILRPARDAAEIIREGRVLHHCVGGYVRSYAEGKTVICVLRRAVQPEEPWRTVEISPQGHVLQDRGAYNDMGRGIALDESYHQMLTMFWSAWDERKKRRKAA